MDDRLPDDRLGFRLRGFLCSLQAVVFHTARLAFFDVIFSFAVSHAGEQTGIVDESQEDSPGSPQTCAFQAFA